MTATGAGSRRQATVRRILSGLAAVAAALAGPARPALAQSVTVGDLQPGVRVRILGPNLASPIVGRLTGLARDTLTVLPEGAESPTAISLSEPVEVQVSRGEHSQLWPWVWKGVVAGSIVGFVAGTLIANHESVGSSHITRDMAVGTGVGAASGGLVGGVLGAVLPSERWKTVYLSYRKTAGRSGSLQVGVRLPM
jgi:hypothetical protein